MKALDSETARCDRKRKYNNDAQEELYVRLQIDLWPDDMDLGPRDEVRESAIILLSLRVHWTPGRWRGFCIVDQRTEHLRIS